MPKNWADRVIVFSVIGLVMWAIIGLPLFNSLSWASNERPSYQAAQQAANRANSENYWLTKDAAGFFTFLLVVVGCFQVGLFLWQLRLIRESLDDAKIAADAAKDSADATVQIARSERAWMIFSTVIQTPFHNASIEGVPGAHTGISLHIEWVNAGRSPANHLTAYGKAVVANIADNVPQFAADWTTASSSMPIGQSRTLKPHPFPLHGDVLEKFKSREIKIFQYSAVRYFDVYQPTEPRVSEACVSVVYDGTHTDFQGRVNINLRIQPAGSQNTIS